MGSSKNNFSDFRVSLPRSWKQFHKYLHEIKKNLGYCTGRYYRFMQKTRHQKSHASVPFNQDDFYKVTFGKIIFLKNTAKTKMFTFRRTEDYFFDRKHLRIFTKGWKWVGRYNFYLEVYTTNP